MKILSTENKINTVATRYGKNLLLHSYKSFYCTRILYVVRMKKSDNSYQNGVVTYTYTKIKTVILVK